MCPGESVWGRETAERPSSALGSLSLTRPDLGHRQSVGLGSFGAGSRADLGVTMPRGGPGACGTTSAGTARPHMCILLTGTLRGKGLGLGLTLRPRPGWEQGRACPAAALWAHRA